MAFTDLDPIEQNMGMSCSKMDPARLVKYIQTYQQAFDRRLAIEGFMERSIFKGMKRIYGDDTAGQIVKWVFYRYKGMWNDEVITFTSFAKGHKWWVDKMYLEMQAALQDSAKSQDQSSNEIFSIGCRKLSSL